MEQLTSEVPVSASHRAWLAEQFAAMPTELERILPSEWAEAKRYLPPSVTALPGYYRFAVAPYIKEILDCLSPDSPVREVAFQKAAQICATVGILENAIGYLIEHVSTAPVMMITADSELAKLRMESNITPMLQYSELTHLIRSTDETSNRKSGKTDAKIEWFGGGFLVPLGALNAAKLRSLSIQFLLRDEIDGWPDAVGKDGDPLELSMDRTKAYESSRKVLDLSTTTILGRSKINSRFRLGDQRYYFVRCLACGFPQILRWSRTGTDGEITGITWDTEQGRLVPGSVRYLCEQCGHAHFNDDKVKLLDPNHGAEWRPTTIPSNPWFRSYHASALYSPVGMQTWEASVLSWLQAWDVEHNRPRDHVKLQTFYNNVLAEPFELRGEKLTFASVSAHRRAAYKFGEVPNQWAQQFCSSPVLLLVATVDVHKDHLPVAVWGWTRGRRAVLIDYWRFEGDATQLDDEGTWGKLRKLIEEREYIADDGKRYRVQLTVIDSGYLADNVYQFASEYAIGVYPIKGREATAATKDREFSEFTTPMGTTAFSVNVDRYKDRWSLALRRGWDAQSVQPHGHFNAPLDITDKQLRELTAEVKRERIEKSTGKRVGNEWHRPSGAANELWDLLVYGNLALDLLAWNFCREQLELDQVDWTTFYDQAPEQQQYFTLPS